MPRIHQIVGVVSLPTIVMADHARATAARAETAMTTALTGPAPERADDVRETGTTDCVSGIVITCGQLPVRTAPAAPPTREDPAGPR
ncbi:hypothetical protein acdb102_08390 [Acidothermaceae bacterium B102]|nr:hypothetical protein acdb102_08390 [Acidothermaceae bacterium B102]